MTQHDPAPASRQDVLACYRARQQTLNDRIVHARGRRGIILRFGLFGMIVIALAYSSRLSQTITGPLLLLGLAAAVVLIWLASRHGAVIARCERLLGFHERNLQRASGEESQSGRTGLEAGQQLRVSGHLYDRDLDILGDDSLFGLLATVRTGPGERGLARYLLEPASHAEAVLRQAAVQELLPQNELRENIALLGATKFQQISASFFDEWLDDMPPGFHPGWRPVLIVTAVLNLLLLLAGLTHLRPWGFILPYLGLSLAAQGALCAMLRPRVVPLLDRSARLQQHIQLISEGLAVLQSANFSNSKLLQLQRTAREPAGAVKALKQLQSSLAIVEQRPREYFFVLSLFLAAGTQAAISISRWKRTHAEAMRLWLAAWSEFEALNALATFAFEHPAGTGDYAWPALLPPDHPPTYDAIALGHPLLANSVTNDIALGTFAVPDSSRPHREEWEPQTPASPSFYLISGSNMAGKSTLLRSIGINAVLAYAGAPVRAQSLALTPLAVGASLALTDSLAEGRSKFLAEVERLAAIVRLSAAAPLLFLVDEIFSGTNSEDRRTAARAVLETLLSNGAIGALSTHDLVLTALATPANSGLNVHMASPDPDDPLGFDYKLKPGVNTASNALAIVRMMGL